MSLTVETCNNIKFLFCFYGNKTVNKKQNRHLFYSLKLILLQFPKFPIMPIIIFIATTLQYKHKKDFHCQGYYESDSVLSVADLPLTLISILGGRQGLGEVGNKGLRCCFELIISFIFKLSWQIVIM